MKIRHIYKVFFSPTGTTKQVVSAIADMMAQNLSTPTFTFDFTLPQARAAAQNGSPAALWPAAEAEDLPAVSAGDLVVFGCPTYAGRLPNLLLKYLNTITGSGALALPVVTFGNRNFDNSLIELRDLLEERGFHTIAAAACSCEHSFSYVLGGGRPDKEDLKEICDFALHAAEKIEKIQMPASATTPASPTDSATPAASSSLADSATSAVSTTPASSAATAPTAVSAASTASLSSVYPAPVQVPGIPAEEGHGGYYQPRDRHGVFIDIRKVKPLTDRSRCLRFAASGNGCAEAYRDCTVPDGDYTAPAGICTAGTASSGAAMATGSGDAASSGAAMAADSGNAASVSGAAVDAGSGNAASDSSRCGVCAAVCPMGAIDPSDITQVPGICIKCGACIKKCPGRAKYYDDPGYLYHKSELEELYSRRAENAFFL